MKTKSYEIPKQMVMEAFKRVKANKGSVGIDKESIEEFEVNLKDNLYKLWNRMSSGCYFPPEVLGVDIPKKSGGKRTLGIPTVSDRIAQMVVKMMLEPKIEVIFHKDSYGYRPNKSALECIGVTRKRCMKYAYVVEFDIKGLFDNIDHELLMKALLRHTDNKMIILYVKRWLNASMIKNGEVIERSKGTPQGGVISPLLANLFLHYVFDKWMEINHPNNPFERYADDAVIHASTLKEAEMVLESLTKRMKECLLELHPDKTKIVYCKKSGRTNNYPNIEFDFLGYTFRQRKAKTERGCFTGFLPAISKKSFMSIKDKIREMKITSWITLTLEELARYLNPRIRGWINYYKAYYCSALSSLYKYLFDILLIWFQKKYSSRKKDKWIKIINLIKKQQPKLFAHW